MTKEARIYNVEKKVSSVSSAGEIWTATRKRMRLQHFLKLYTKINSKCIKDLNVGHDTIEKRIWVGHSLT